MKLPPLQPWLIAFVVTQLIEVPLYLKASERKWVAAFGASLVTHPIVWFLFPRYWPRGHPETLLACAALFSIAVESAWLASFGVKKPIEWAFVANVCSFGAWLALQHFRGV